MIIVTGGAGFIGSNIVKALNLEGHTDIVVVDDLTDGTKFKNIADCQIQDYLDKDDFLAQIQANNFAGEKITAILHEGACTVTTAWDGRFMLHNNYDYSKALLHYCLDHKIQFIYASSGAVYGNSTVFAEQLANEKPINVYGYSKFLFDQYVRRMLPEAKSQVVGLRYFNVYGPREQHKGKMASMAFHLNEQLHQEGVLKLFEGTDGYDNGEQRRDFIYVGDVAKVNLWFLQNPDKNGIFNLGTGKSQPFNDVAKAVIDWHGKGKLKYIEFPKELIGRYQSFTEADITKVRQVGYDGDFKTVAEGMKIYLDWLQGEI